jgi:hypothetical protein
MSLYLHVVKTKLEAQEAIEKAIEFFGKEGLGLELVDQGPCCVHFKGDGGHVSVRAVTRHGTTLNLATCEWDDHVRRFIHEID